MTAIASPSPATLDVGRCTTAIEERLVDFLEGERARWTGSQPELVEPIESLTRMVLSGGKRLRPAFAYWGFVGAGGAPGDDRLLDLGAALELLHAAALIHDDVMDGSSTRRGAPTVHCVYEHRHTVEAWRGEARRFGEGMAVLVGDLAFVYADSLIASNPRHVVEIFNETRVELSMGQYLDVAGTAARRADYELARFVAVYKSGKYTIERPLHMGAALAGRLDELAGPFSDYGLPLGEAFQLRDDLLGAFGDPALTGKPVGDDLRDGKPTALLALAVERADRAAARALRRVGQHDLDDDGVAAVQRAIEATGARRAVETSIARLCDEAIAAIVRAPVTAECRRALHGLAQFVADRDV